MAKKEKFVMIFWFMFKPGFKFLFFTIDKSTKLKLACD